MTPVQPAQRIEILDVLRGAALFGILASNMRAFHSPMPAYFDHTLMWTGTADRRVPGEGIHVHQHRERLAPRPHASKRLREGHGSDRGGQGHKLGPQTYFADVKAVRFITECWRDRQI